MWRRNDPRSAITGTTAAEQADRHIVGGVPCTGLFYDVDHLTTYTFPGPRDAIEKGMRKLRFIERTNDLKATRYSLVLKPRELAVFDSRRHKVVESYPLETVSQVRAFISHNLSDAYNNVVAVMVAVERGKVDVHYFQAINISGEEVRHNITSAMDNCPPSQAGHHRSVLTATTRTPAPLSVPQPDPELMSRRSPSVGPSVYGGYFSKKPVPPGGYTFEDPPAARAPYNTLATGYTSGMRVTQDGYDPVREKGYYLLLMYCLDDFEVFENRLKDNPSSHGSGYPMGRAQQSPVSSEIVLSVGELVDVLRKLKLSFNLLAAQQENLANPSAAELLRRLFALLKHSLHASRGVIHQAPGQLAASVIAPLLSRGAIEFLNQHLGPGELELWDALGAAWTTPRDGWAGHVESYTPVFVNRQSLIRDFDNI